MIGTEQERAALKRILAVLKPILTDHKPPIAIDWVGKGSIAVGREFESAINAVREHKDDDAIRAMLAPDDAVQTVTIDAGRWERVVTVAEAAKDWTDAPSGNISSENILIQHADRLKREDLDPIVPVLRGEATRDE